jgi:hypothetical protein
MSFPQWASWRRDAAIALVSAGLTALVLGLVGWPLLTSERRDAQAARQAAAEARSQAQESAAQARRYREQLEEALSRNLLRGVGTAGPKLSAEEVKLLDQIAGRSGDRER